MDLESFLRFYCIKFPVIIAILIILRITYLIIRRKFKNHEK